MPESGRDLQWGGVIQKRRCAGRSTRVVNRGNDVVRTRRVRLSQLRRKLRPYGRCLNSAWTGASGYTGVSHRRRGRTLNDELKLVPYEKPELRHGSMGDWWALGKMESAVQNPDGSMRTFSVEVGLSLTPHGDFQPREAEFWRLVAAKLPQIAEQLSPND